MRPRAADAGPDVPLDATDRRRASAPAVGFAWACLISSAGLVAATIADLFDGARSADGLGLCAVVAGAIGISLRRSVKLPTSATAQTALIAVATTWAALVAISTVVYVVTGGFESAYDALFESVAGYGTTAITTLRDPQVLSDGQLLWRALTQWFGGFLALVLVVSVLPFLGLGLPRPVRIHEPEGIQHLDSARLRRRHRRLAIGYAALTGVGLVLYVLGGMSAFDALAHALTTISTGGFTTTAGGFDAVDSPLLDWMAIGGMALGGSALALVIRGLRGAAEPLLSSIELRAYAIVLVGGSVVATWWTRPAGGITLDSAREAIFSVVSVVSTTGYWIVDWGQWPAGAQLLLLVLMGVGAMSGSPGGGFRLLRALALIDYVGRALKREINRQGVYLIRLGQRVLPDDVVDRMVGYQVVYLALLAAGAFALALGGATVMTSVSGAVSALSTVGPALGELAPGAPVDVLSVWDRLMLMVLIACGRLEMYPVLVAASVLPVRFVRRLARRG